jgi:hypothetical protein
MGLTAFVLFAAIVLIPALLAAGATSREEDTHTAPSLKHSLIGCLLYLPIGIGAFGCGVAFARRTLSNGTLPELAFVIGTALFIAVPSAVLCVLLPRHRLLVWFIGVMLCLAANGAVGVWGPP